MPSGKVTYRQRDVLLTKFPFSDLTRFKVRPVLVLSNDAYNRRFSDLVVRADTITSLEQQIVLKRIGRLRKETYRGVVALIQKLIHPG